MKHTTHQLLEQADRDEIPTVDMRNDERIEHVKRNGVFVSLSKAGMPLWGKIEVIGKHLEPTLPQPFAGISTEFQDSNSLASLTYSRYFYFQFSGIGRLFIACADEVAISVDESLKKGFEESIAYIESQGFIYLDADYDELHAPYTGINPLYRNLTWWDRFFGYP
jgi:hypothetical protein